MKGARMQEKKQEEMLCVDKKMTIDGQKFEITLVFKSPDNEHETVEDKIRHLINGDKIK